MSLISVRVSAVGSQGRQSPRRRRYRERDEASRRRLADGAKSCALLVRARFTLLCLVVCLFTIFPADVLCMMFIFYCPSHAVHLDSRCCLCRYHPSRCYWSCHCFFLLLFVSPFNVVCLTSVRPASIRPGGVCLAVARVRRAAAIHFAARLPHSCSRCPCSRGRHGVAVRLTGGSCVGIYPSCLSSARSRCAGFADGLELPVKPATLAMLCMPKELKWWSSKTASSVARKQRARAVLARSLLAGALAAEKSICLRSH
jgi:hypothetical protein